MFWKDTWMNGQTLQEAFPILFGLARRKSISVCDALQNGRWMKGLQRINSLEQIGPQLAPRISAKMIENYYGPKEVTRKCVGAGYLNYFLCSII
jgi:hypothetical protein